MSWNNCRKCMVPRSNFNSALFKVLLTLKLLHGSRGGAKGSTLEDIAMQMMKLFSIDGDVKSQVLATLKYGVKMHYIQRNKEKFRLILPASSIFLAPCKFKEEEIERINCIYPPVWQSNACNDASCHPGGQGSCCGKRKRSIPTLCCQVDEDDDRGTTESCSICRSKAKRSKSSASVCSKHCGTHGGHYQNRKSKTAPCPRSQPPLCARKSKNKRKRRDVAPFDDLCAFCTGYEDDASSLCNPGRNYAAHKNCTCCYK